MTSNRSSITLKPPPHHHHRKDILALSFSGTPVCPHHSVQPLCGKSNAGHAFVANGRFMLSSL